MAIINLVFILLIALLYKKSAMENSVDDEEVVVVVEEKKAKVKRSYRWLQRFFKKLFITLLSLAVVAGATYLVVKNIDVIKDFTVSKYVWVKEFIVEKKDAYLADKSESTWDIYLVESTWEALDIVVDTGIDMDISTTGDVITGSLSDDMLWWDVEIIDQTQNVTMMEGIKYLMDTYDVTLNSEWLIRFTYVPFTSPDYKYYKAAYDKKLIGKSTNPDTKLTCDTYIVMKWLVSWWDVGSYSDIKKAYWEKASQLDELNDCVRGTLLTIANL